MYVDIYYKYSRAALVLFTLESYVDSVKRKMGDYGWIVAKAPIEPHVYQTRTSLAVSLEVNGVRGWFC